MVKIVEMLPVGREVVVHADSSRKARAKHRKAHPPRSRKNSNASRRSSSVQRRRYRSSSGGPSQLGAIPTAAVKTALMEKTKGKVSSASRMALSMMLPHSVQGERISRKYELVKTALAMPYTTYVNTWSGAQSVNNKTLEDGRYVTAVSKNVLAATVTYYQNLAVGGNYQEAMYLSYFNGRQPRVVDNEGDGVVSYPPANTFNVPIYGVDTGHLPITNVYQLPLLWAEDAYIGDETKFHPHGDVLYAGTHEGRRGIWIDGSAEANPSVTVGGWNLVGRIIKVGEVEATVQVNIRMYRLSGQTWVNVQDLIYTLVETDINVPITYAIRQSGYYAFDFAVQSPSPCPIGVDSPFFSLQEFGVRGWGSCFGHRPIPYIEDKSASLQSVVVTGASMMMSPQAPILYRTGQVAALQLPRGLSWESVVASHEVFASGENAYICDLNKGVYGYMKFNGEDNIIPTSPFTSQAGRVIDVNFPILPPGGWMVYSAVVPAEPGAVVPYPSGATFMTFAWQLEFSTTDVWFATRYPSAGNDATEMAVQLLRSAPQFFDNPFHFSDITNWIAKAAKSVSAVAPAILGAIGAAIPEAEPFTTAAGGVFHFLNSL